MLSLVRVVWIDGRVVEGGTLLRCCIGLLPVPGVRISLNPLVLSGGGCRGGWFAGRGVPYP